MGMITVEHRVTGAEVAMARCDTCRTSPREGGLSLLPEKHLGYGNDAGQLRDTDEEPFLEAAEKHDKEHPDHSIRVLFFHAK